MQDNHMQFRFQNSKLAHFGSHTGAKIEPAYLPE